MLKSGLFYVISTLCVMFALMLYVYRGEVWVTPAGQTVPEYQAARMEYAKEQHFAHVITYIYYVYTKKDNPYWGLPPKERRSQVVANYKLFDWTTYDKVENTESVRKLIEFYKKINLTENELNEDAFRQKTEYWRTKLMQMGNNPEEEASFAKALEVATKLAQEFKLKAELDEGMGEQEGVALYLFEIPEDKKPHHQRMKL